MSYIDLCIIAFSVSMDAFAVALCCGLAKHEKAFRTALILALVFGGFQALMPLTGWSVLYPFAEYLKNFGPYIMLVLLNGIGAYMIYEAFSANGKDDEKNKELTAKYILLSGVAVSIDALGIGASLAVNRQPVGEAMLFMGIFTLVISFIGYYIGYFLGHLFEKKLEFLGGTAIILIGWKLFLEYLGYI
ncbi:MAG: manganese efflux pump MntP family protein [Victivallaceae bacterium]|nr:manganese efflux pump MntP family protein [Victivallaceae bacterium]